MFVVIFKQHGALNCAQQVFGPFDLYTDAEEALSDGSVPALHFGMSLPEGTETDGWRYIQELEWVKGCVL